MGGLWNGTSANLTQPQIEGFLFQTLYVWDSSGIDKIVYTPHVLVIQRNRCP